MVLLLTLRLFEKGRLLEVSNAELNNSNCLFFFEILSKLEFSKCVYYVLES